MRALGESLSVPSCGVGRPRWTVARTRSRDGECRTNNGTRSATRLIVCLASNILLAATGPAALSQVHFVAKLLADPPLEFREFGDAAAIDGDVLVVGTASASAFIFERESDDWVQVASFMNGGRFDQFGRGVACSGEAVLVGMPGVMRNTLGRCYVYERSEGQWNQVQILQPEDQQPGDRFGGYSPALAGDTALIGAPRRDNVRGSSAGAVYVFRRNVNGEWIQMDTLLAPDGRPYEEFGHTIAMEPDLAALGTPFASDFGTSSGAVYIYERDANGAWQFVTKLLAGDGAAGDKFGLSVGIDKGTVVVGAPAKSDAGLVYVGAAYVFQRGVTGEWEQVSRIRPRDRLAARDAFGRHVAISGSSIAVATPLESGSQGRVGRTYVFERVGQDEWVQIARKTSGEARGGFGHAVAMSGNTIVIGDKWDSEQAALGGAVFIFGKSPQGNMNCDLFLDALDIEPFILAIFDPDEYENRYPDCDINRADVNLDGAINGLDIEPFLELLFGR